MFTKTAFKGAAAAAMILLAPFGASAQGGAGFHTIAALGGAWDCYWPDGNGSWYDCPTEVVAGSYVLGSPVAKPDFWVKKDFDVPAAGELALTGTAYTDGGRGVELLTDWQLALEHWNGTNWSGLHARAGDNIQRCFNWAQDCDPVSNTIRTISVKPGKYRLKAHTAYFSGGGGQFYHRTKLDLRVDFRAAVPTSPAPTTPATTAVAPGEGLCQCVDPLIVSDLQPVIGETVSVTVVAANRSQTQGTDCAASVREGPGGLFPADASEIPLARQVAFLGPGQISALVFSVPIRAGATTIGAAVSNHGCTPVTISPRQASGVAGSVLEVGVLAPIPGSIVYVGTLGNPGDPGSAIAAARPGPGGAFQVALPAGQYTLWAEAAGYIKSFGLVEVGRSVNVARGQITRPVDFRLAPLPVGVLPPASETLDVAWIGQDADVVGRRFDPGPNGEPDGHFRVRYGSPVARQITYMRLREASPAGVPSGPRQWDTEPGNAWILGVVAAGGARLNPTDNDVSITVAAGTSHQFEVFANDDGSQVFQPGQGFLVELRFADGSTITATTSIP